MLEVFTSPKNTPDNSNVHTALQHLLLQTAVVPLTEGNKTKMRHVGFANAPFRRSQVVHENEFR